MFQALLHGMGELLAYFYSIIPNYGLAIIMLTILVRTAMIPLAIKQAHSMQANRGNAEKMRKLQPQIKKIREKYKDDRQRQYEEQKKLYEENGVNMLGGLSGCLPMLLQMPIFFAMYAVLQGCSSLFGGRDHCEPGYHIPDGSPLYQAIVEQSATFLGTNLELRPQQVWAASGLIPSLPYVVLIGVMAGTMWYQTQMMMKAQPTPDPQFAATQKIMKFMPIMLVFFSWNFPAGLILYWSATNTWTIGQQWVLMKKYGGTLPEPPNGKAKTTGKKPAAGPAADEPAPKGRKTPSTSVAKDKPPTAKARGTGASPNRGGQKRPAGSGSTGGSRKASGGSRPAAKQARPGAKGAAGSGKGGVNGQSGKQAPSTNGKAGAADAPPPAAKPKGSGARKGNKGGRR